MRRDDSRAFPQPDRAKDNSPAIYRWVSGWKGNESRQGRKNTRVLPHGFFRPYGAWARLGIGDPPLKRWAIIGRPCGTGCFRARRGRVCLSPAGRKTIAQRFIAGFPGGRETSPVRDERTRVFATRFLSPLRGLARLGIGCPPLKRWALFGRPCGTISTNSRLRD